MGRPKRVRIAAWSLIALACVLGCALCSILFARRFIHVRHYSQFVVASLEKRLHRQVTFSSAAITLWPRPGLRLADLELSKNPPEPGHPFLTMKGLRVQVALRPLLRRRLVVDQIVLERPVMVAARDRHGRLSFADLLGEAGSAAPASYAPSNGAASIFVAKTVIRGGDLTFIDDFSPGGRTFTKLSNLDLEAERVGYAEPPDLKFRSRSEAYGGRWEISGETTLDKVPSFALTVLGRGVKVERFGDGVGHGSGSTGRPSKGGMTGVLDLRARLHGKGRDVRAWDETLVGTGRMTLRNARIPSSNILEAVIRTLLGLFGRMVPTGDDVMVSEPTTIDRFDQAFEVKGGRVRMEPVHLVTSDYVLDGRGSVGLDKTLDFDTRVRLTPKGAQKMIAVSSVSVLDKSPDTLRPIRVRITGTAASPIIRPQVSVIPGSGLPKWIPGERIKRGMEAGAGAVRSRLGRLFGQRSR